MGIPKTSEYISSTGASSFRGEGSPLFVGGLFPVRTCTRSFLKSSLKTPIRHFHSKTSQSSGFTLLEVLLSVSIIAMLAGISLPIYLAYSNRNDLTIATETTANALRRAATYSRGVNRDDQWGVSVKSGQIIVYKGASFATRDAGFDEVTTIPTSITVGGTSEFVFAKLSGMPNAAGSVALTSTNLNETKTVTLNAKGMVNY